MWVGDVKGSVQQRAEFNRTKVSSSGEVSSITISWWFPVRRLGGSCRQNRRWLTRQLGWLQHRRWPRGRTMPAERRKLTVISVVMVILIFSTVCTINDNYLTHQVQRNDRSTRLCWLNGQLWLNDAFQATQRQLFYWTRRFNSADETRDARWSLN